MTSPSSYVFYGIRNLQRERKEGTCLTRVFITDRKMTVYSKQIIKTAKSGVLFEKILDQQTYSLHENRNGEKYLKRFTKSASGSITDTSLQVAMNTRNGNYHLIPRGFTSECKELQENTILGWFGYDPMPGLVEDFQDGFLFPALKDQGFLRDSGIRKTLANLQVSTSGVTKALRENNSWESFVMDICKPTVSTMQDVMLIKQYPHTLLPIAGIKFPSSISEMYKADSDALLNIISAFSPRDINILRFMFNHLPATLRDTALQIMFSLTTIHNRRKANTIPTNRYDSGVRSVASSLKRVPAKLRGELAEKLLNCLATYEEFKSSDSSANFTDTYLNIPLANVFRYWFAEAVLEPQLRTKVTYKAVEDRYFELFGTLPKYSSSLRVHSTKDLTFYSLHMTYTRGNISQYHTDLFTSLSALAVKNRPQDKGTGAGYSLLNGYVGNDGQFVTVSGGLYSLEDILNIIEAGALATDEWLAKMGRKITPENRRTFLTFGSKERKFKNTWKYYDWGVTDPEKILSLKKAKICNKEDVKTYNELPAGMFYELLALHSGHELSAA